MSTKSFYLKPDGSLEKDLDMEAIASAFESRAGVLWMDIEGIAEEEMRPLETVFKFHDLAIDDCYSERIHPPKVDDFGDHLFVIVHGVNHYTESDIVETSQLEIFISRHYVVTHHNLPQASMEGVLAAIDRDDRPMHRGADFLAHYIINALIDNVLPMIDVIGDVTEAVEEEAVHSPQRETLETIQRLKRSIIRLHRVMVPQREMLYHLSRGDFEIIGEESRIYYRNIYDHIQRIEELNQNLRERADTALSSYMSSIANRQNETMRILSIVAAIFLPLSLVAGIYGMNFEYMPELRLRWGYYAVLGLMGLVIIGVVWWLWARNLIGLGRKSVSAVLTFKVEPRKLLWFAGGRPRQRRDGGSYRETNG